MRRAGRMVIGKKNLVHRKNGGDSKKKGKDKQHPLLRIEARIVFPWLGGGIVHRTRFRKTAKTQSGTYPTVKLRQIHSGLL